ncbi:PTS ascorbate transporter subunit IIC [Massilicoli timonensis]|uniref:Ascorbate-specific PTS system EIIC component n=1 Tax=Massilicoli timonensis TaxID=2015901 RepID=A0ABT1SJB5_9FIRM|nr:PTS ascorbate transporter subunit IIC [Massilicoli timonensis]MCQ5121322.1 PTS ascorbate transporter subunit IIC [Massilicoli timonensis]HIR15530.1 PTS ascorbate transporter subunit IIC [Candidatus Onthosoma merdavium]
MLDFLLNIMKTPAIVLGLVALIGLLLQKKNVGQVFSGTVKTALGMLVLSAGSSLIVSEISPFVDLFSLVFHLEGFATSSEAVVGAMQNAVPVIASTSAIIMAVGFLVNVVIARFSPLKYIFLTGHMMWILSVAIAGSLYAASFSETMIMVVGSVLQGVLMVVLPAIGQPTVRKVTGSDHFAIAHLTMLGTVPAAYVGGWLGDKNKNAEDIKLPESLEFFKDTSMSVSIVMGVFYLLVVILAGPEAVAGYAGDQNYIVYGILKALGFTAGILILLQGVRMFLGELVPAFKGISDKLVPGAIPALDVPALFAYAPNSLMIGFVTAVIGMIAGMFVSSALFKVVPLVSIIGAFFTGGVAGIFGNARGGTRGAVISGLVYGFLLIVGSGFLFTIFDYAVYGAAGVGHDCLDVMAVMIAMKYPYIGIAIIVAAFALLCWREAVNKKMK